MQRVGQNHRRSMRHVTQCKVATHRWGVGDNLSNIRAAVFFGLPLCIFHQKSNRRSTQINEICFVLFVSEKQNKKNI